MTGFIVKHWVYSPHTNAFSTFNFSIVSQIKAMFFCESASSLQFELFMDDLGPGIVSCLNISCN